MAESDTSPWPYLRLHHGWVRHFSTRLRDDRIRNAPWFSRRLSYLSSSWTNKRRCCDQVEDFPTRHHHGRIRHIISFRSESSRTLFDSALSWLNQTNYCSLIRGSAAVEYKIFRLGFVMAKLEMPPSLSRRLSDSASLWTNWTHHCS